jgi:Cu+-exporting ATPase
MPKNITFSDAFLVSGIMCYKSCGVNIQTNTQKALAKRLPNEKIETFVDAEPYGLGMHKISVKIKTINTLPVETERQIPDLIRQTILSVDKKFRIVGLEEQENKEDYKNLNLINIVINIATIALILMLSALATPSLMLNIALTAIAFTTTAYTAREYLINFIKNFRLGLIANANMGTTITLGWSLSLFHTLYHLISMPLMVGISMTFMCFIMPVLLITIINVMDGLNILVLEKAKTIQLKGINNLFPKMSAEYNSCEDSELARSFEAKLAEYEKLLQCSASLNTENEKSSLITAEKELITFCDRLSQPSSFSLQLKGTLTKGMFLKIQVGECFPADCKLLDSQTIIDAALITGESRQKIKFLDPIPAGAINLGKPVFVYLTANPYNSTINKLLFVSNGPYQRKNNEQNQKFGYIYGSLFFATLLGSVLLPLGFGILTIPVALQNLIGILLAICPCTLVIAHKFPRTLSIYYRSKQNILLRTEQLLEQTEEFETYVFDKTGTLTTGDSKVAAQEGINRNLWRLLGVIESRFGRNHPIAQAITSYCTQEKIPTTTQLPTIQINQNVNQSNGISVEIEGHLIHIGNQAYMDSQKIEIISLSEKITQDIKAGMTPIYVAEGKTYSGVILIEHEIRKGVANILNRLKQAGKKLILLTGDTQEAAYAFSIQVNQQFDAILSQHDPDKKVDKLRNWGKICFVGDGLNDAPCSRIVSENEGLSCAIAQGKMASYFTDLSLDETLNYLLKHTALNRNLQKNIQQNQGILLYGLVTLLTFLSVHTYVGVALSPLIPILIMSTTTTFILFNCYRVKAATDFIMDSKTDSYTSFLTSDYSLACLIGIGLSMTMSLLITTLTSSGSSLIPTLTFNSGLLPLLALGGVGVAITLGIIIISQVFFGLISVKSTLEEQPNVSHDFTTLISPSGKCPTVTELPNVEPLSPIAEDRATSNASGPRL